ncbi:uncharacterized protein LOC107462117 [Arachis duranensis]|uniref:Uncharacterized protein LOC107462117 n=1 Tax=Arachis duranensis TaxID=130453 RepID=A0A6P4B9V8_ARADU|nr:uncharacterized protein LOC107462117 [Arachis duranensis]
MNIFSWNTRGIANRDTVRTLKELKRLYKPDVIILLEPRCSGTNAEEVIQSIGSQFSCVEEAVGFSGGVWVLWDDASLMISIIKKQAQFIHMRVKITNNPSWYITAVYASPQERLRRQLWEDIRDIATERKGGSIGNMNACRKFQRWMCDCNLIDLGYVGSKFTWKGAEREGMERILKRLDRAVANKEWKMMFPDARVETLPRCSSDLYPLLIKTIPARMDIGEKPFRYEIMWETHSEYKEVINDTWKLGEGLPQKLNLLTNGLKTWNKEVFRDVFRRKERALRRLNGIQKSPDYGSNQFLYRLEKELTEELEGILKQEELLWLQKSRQLWITEGDRNTRFYHTKTLIRRRKNRIVKLRNSDGEWCEDIECLKGLAIKHFDDLYTEDQQQSFQLNTVLTYPPMESEHLAIMEAKLKHDEIKEALFGIGSLKAPGEDGYPTHFFKENWSLVQEAFCSYIRYLWLNPEAIAEDFIRRSLEEFGIPHHLRRIVMSCVESVSYKLLWNGCKLEKFLPTRGIRQGDPISPYLFVIAMDKLSQLIEEKVNEGRWKPMTARRQGPAISHLLFADDLLLFVEASTNQTNVVKGVLEEFKLASGFQVNISKTSIFFSKNVTGQTKEEIKNQSGFIEADCLGRYLGAMLTNARKGKEKFKNLIDKVAGKLKGWKSSCLSFAGRVTLAKSVISPSMNFDMMHMKIPKGICYEIEKMQRKFVWRGDMENRKFHAVNWNTLCQPKYLGGLGFKKLETMNVAFLLKILWKIHTDKEAFLWVQTLVNKYGRDKILLHDMKVCVTDSPLWKELTKLQGLFYQNISRSIGDGKEANMWRDRWVKNEPPLLLNSKKLIDNTNINMTVSEAVIHGQWNFEFLQQFLHEKTLCKIRALPPAEPELGSDGLRWNPASDGNFSISSTYRILENHGEETDQIWRIIWKWRGPERIKCFIWLVVRERIMTSHRRARIFGMNSSCHRCTGVEENTIHMLRDCPVASRVWVKLIHHEHIHDFFRAPFNAWIRWNLAMDLGTTKQGNWNTQFLVTCWWLWKWRNQEIFNPPFQRPMQPLPFILKQVKLIQEAFKKEGQRKNKIETNICWECPPEDWMKVNTDGAAKGNPGMAGCGGLIRNYQGRWIAGFVANIGYCTAYYAELWGVYYGLKTAWELGMRKIILEVDSKAVVDVIKGATNFNKHPEAIVRKIVKILQRKWQTKLVHSYREGNRGADCMANESLFTEPGYHFIDQPSTKLRSILADNCRGATLPRLISVL